MIVVMEKSSSDQQVEHIANRISELGLKSHIIRGTERTVIAAVGDDRKIKIESFERCSARRILMGIVTCPFSLILVTMSFLLFYYLFLFSNKSVP